MKHILFPETTERQPEEPEVVIASVLKANADEKRQDEGDAADNGDDESGFVGIVVAAVVVVLSAVVIATVLLLVKAHRRKKAFNLDVSDSGMGTQVPACEGSSILQKWRMSPSYASLVWIRISKSKLH